MRKHDKCIIYTPDKIYDTQYQFFSEDITNKYYLYIFNICLLKEKIIINKLVFNIILVNKELNFYVIKDLDSKYLLYLIKEGYWFLTNISKYSLLPINISSVFHLVSLHDQKINFLIIYKNGSSLLQQKIIKNNNYNYSRVYLNGSYYNFSTILKIHQYDTYTIIRDPIERFKSAIAMILRILNHTSKSNTIKKIINRKQFLDFLICLCIQSIVIMKYFYYKDISISTDLHLVPQFIYFNLLKKFKLKNTKLIWINDIKRFTEDFLKVNFTFYSVSGINTIITDKNISKYRKQLKKIFLEDYDFFKTHNNLIWRQ